MGTAPSGPPEPWPHRAQAAGPHPRPTTAGGPSRGRRGVTVEAARWAPGATQQEEVNHQQDPTRHARRERSAQASAPKMMMIARYHPAWRPGQAAIAAGRGADRRPAKNAAAPSRQSRKAHLAARPLHSPEGSVRVWECLVHGR
jgi:hypothetical protein